MKKLFIRAGSFLLAAFLLMSAILVSAPVQVSATGEYTVIGTWVFNDSLTFPVTNISASLNFICGDEDHILDSLTVTSDSLFFYGDNFTGSVYSYGYWSQLFLCCQTINFGETEQVVSEEFYTWLNANATFQAPPPAPGPLVEAVTDLQDQKILEQVLVPILAILPIGLVCLVGYKGLRKALDLLRGILHQA